MARGDVGAAKLAALPGAPKKIDLRLEIHVS